LNQLCPAISLSSWLIIILSGIAIINYQFTPSYLFAAATTNNETKPISGTTSAGVIGLGAEMGCGDALLSCFSYDPFDDVKHSLKRQWRAAYMYFYRQTKLAQGFTWKDLDPNSGERVKAHRARNSDQLDEQLTSAQLDELNASPFRWDNSDDFVYTKPSNSSIMLEAYLNSTPQQTPMILPINVLHLYGAGWIVIESTPVISPSRIMSAPIMTSNRLLPAPVIIASPEST